MVLRLTFFAMVLAAIAPLSTNIFGISVATPYIPFAFLLVTFFPFWIKHSRRIFRRGEEYAFIAAQFLILIFALQSIDPRESFGASFFAVYAAGLYWFARILFKTQSIDHSHLLIGAVTITFILVVLAVLQFITKQNIGVVPAYFGDDLVQGVYESRAGGVRVSGTFSNSNVFAQVLMFYSSMILAYMLFFLRSVSFSLTVIFSMMSISVILLSLSRSGTLGVVIAHIALYWYWVLQGGNRRVEIFIILVLLALLGMIAVFLLISLIETELVPGVSRFFDNDIGGASISSRVETNLGALQILQNPRIFLFGVGNGQFYEALEIQDIQIDYKSYIPAEKNFGSVHNWPLLIATEHGVIVLFLYVYALYKSIKRGLFLRKTNTRTGVMTAAIALVLAILYTVPFSFGTAGTTPWLLTPVVILLAWIQNEHDIRHSSARLNAIPSKRGISIR